MKRKKHVWFVGLACAMPVVLAAQQTEPLTGVNRLYEDGRQLFLRQDFAAARQTLSKYMAENPQTVFMAEADYMLVCTAYELKEPDCIEKLNAYLEKYPESRYTNRVLSLIASAYFYEGKYAEALATFKGCDLEALPDAERDDCVMRMGNACMQTGNLDEAAVWFRTLKAVSPKYREEAIYQLGYIDYTEKRYGSALDAFVSLQSDPNYAEIVPYYIGDIYLIQQAYDKAQNIAVQYLKQYPQHKNASEMQRIYGQACFGKGDYAAAVQPLEKYRMAVDFPQRKALYQLGMSYYYTGVYSKAAQVLGESASTKDAMSQNAYLHMGLAYLQLKTRNQARMAFEQASTMTYDKYIQEQALYNYALCIHETSYSPFAESVTVFERFLNDFPNSRYVEKVNDYLVEVYMNTRSYDAALKSIAKISQPGPRILEAKQKILFRLGVQAFANAAFENAIDYFSQSLRLGSFNVQTKADAYYWRGESKYRLEQYQQATADFRQYLEFAPNKNVPEYALALYNLGYTAFKQKQYSTALTWFTRCTDKGSVNQPAVQADAYNRMGDCCFYARRFEDARQLYARASETDPAQADYALYQEAFVKGLQRNYSGKIETLNQLLSKYANSQYVDDALYEQGRAFVQMEDNVNAINRYKLLVERYPESPMARVAANEIGLLYYQNDKYPEAIAAYKQVISRYPGSEEARMAQRDLKSIYIDLNKVDDYMAFASSIPGGANFDVNERDSLTYVAAERVYMKGNIAEAQTSFTRYLQSFPEGAFSLNANYYLGLIHYNKKEYNEAMAYLEKVMAYPNNKYSSDAMLMCAVMSYSQKQYDKALEIYKQLIVKVTSPEERRQAETGALRSAYMAVNHEEVIWAASALLADAKVSPEVENEARYYRAKSYMETGKQEAALQDWIALSADTRNVYGAEAKYRVAQTYFDMGETQKSEKVILEYIEVSTPHAYWLARGFVLLSDVYVKLGRKLDAKQYLLSLQQNYHADDDIAEMIETRLAKLNSVK